MIGKARAFLFVAVLGLISSVKIMHVALSEIHVADTPQNRVIDTFIDAINLDYKHIPLASRSFFKALAVSESGNNYQTINKYGYIGKYQFGEQTLIALGYYLPDGTRRNDWIGEWTGKDGIFSKEDFLASEIVQDKAAISLASSNWDVATRNNLDSYIGKQIKGALITKAGIVAGMHLKGAQSVIDFVKSNQDSQDAFGTSVHAYMKRFSVYQVAL